MNPAGVHYLAWLRNIRDERRLHDVSQTADDGHAPRRVPRARDRRAILGRYHTVALAIVHQARRTLSPLDVGLGEQHEESAGWLYQGRIAPTVVVAFCRTGDTAETGDGGHATGGVLREEALVGVGPLLHPSACTFGDAVGGMLCGQRLQVVVFITEGQAVVVEPEHQAHAIGFGMILAGHVLTMTALAGQHPVVGSDIRCEPQASEQCRRVQLQRFPSLGIHHQLAVGDADAEPSVGRCHCGSTTAARCQHQQRREE